MGSDARNLRMFFFPFMAPGHMIPLLDIVKLFASRGVDATMITTPANAKLFQPSIDRQANHGHPLKLLLLPFPSTEASGLPQGCENVASLPVDKRMNFLVAVNLLRQPFEKLLEEHRPDCIVTDMFLPWTVEIARELGIPRLVFHGTSFFSLCLSDIIQHPDNNPHESLPEDAETYVVPGFPHHIELLKAQIPDRRNKPEFADVIRRVRESESRSYGAVVNSFYELEPDYAQYYRNAVGRRAWHVGPVSLLNKEEADKVARGGGDLMASVDSKNCLSWLDSQKPNSVLYVCFGSMGQFNAAQLRELALGLEASDHPFIWVVKNGDEVTGWLPEGFEERVVENEKKGLVIRGWAPQVLILNHESVGGFLTHCGWNSSLEGIGAGLPMVTWPLGAEQFYNERLIVDVLRIGVAVGVKKFAMQEEERELVRAEEIEKAVARLMGGGDEADGMRERASVLGVRAKRAVEEGGSSDVDLGRLIDELTEMQTVGGVKKLEI